MPIGGTGAVPSHYSWGDTLRQAQDRLGRPSDQIRLKRRIRRNVRSLRQLSRFPWIRSISTAAGGRFCKVKVTPVVRNGFRNRILDGLPRKELGRIRKALTEVEAAVRDEIYEPNKPFKYVYFPETAIASVVNVMEDRTEIEVATIGYEGTVGLPVFLGSRQSPARAFWQVAGTAFRLDAAFVEKEKRRGTPVALALGLYTQGFFSQIAQSATCNRLHTLEQRCARWLLMTHDRVPGDDFPLKQEFLAQMLGARRTGISEVAGRLQRKRLIKYSRGWMNVTDRRGLEGLSCECYQVVAREYRRLLR
jgi:Crp-like helix-turn-helix protein